MKVTIKLSKEQVEKMKKYLNDVGDDLGHPYQNSAIKKDDIQLEIQGWFDSDHPSQTYHEKET